MGPAKEKIDALEKRLAEAGIVKKDIEEKFIKSSGRGGQKINKTSSAVFLRHIPTGITVKCGSDRSRNTNRFLAMRRLVEKVEIIRGGASKEKNAITHKVFKIKKQKAKRKKRTKEKLVTLNNSDIC
ncbi:conserved hypothetical protein [Desulfamplus magnetovallimortis]|uniref:Prokaryotic-type class I peptide chain release factors domain-containing protein n=1 Tax=Desulfamplus magnetovallimortis TaxID=1246637 RepID=A0A1W1HLE4_9BACT|nr:peptide chain release factor-like protein [Desulfamplus magnetovallimortis]SLM33256.1 conserved hypothetical protein [Desulfamplus magnetovallimortis]